MKIRSLKLVCFSPTGATKAIVQRIACGIDHNAVELMDIAKPSARIQPITASENDLFVVAAPSYMGKEPALLRECLHVIQAFDTPAVCVVVYGNRVCENTLRELKRILTDRGCMPIAGAALIGEHSFFIADAPTGEGRPDDNDLDYAELFGRKINEKIRSVPSIEHILADSIPGGGAPGIQMI